MKKIIISTLMLLCSVFISFGQDIAGKWYGTLEIGGSKLRLGFNITTAPDGGYTTLMDSPDQGARDIPTTSTTFKNGKLTITSTNMRMTYDAALTDGVLDGTFSQGISVPLKMTREEIVLNRPQTPKAPFPYKSEDISFRNEAAGINLAGTLTIPQGKGKFPAVVLISGSGGQNRDEELLGHKPFLVIADYLTRNGIAVLRYDDRGIAASEGDYHSASVQDFASDALSAARYLTSRPEIESKTIGLAGHSEGGIIVYMLAGDTGKKDIAFIVSMAGPTVKGDILTTEQRRLIGKESGTPDYVFEQNEKLISAAMKIVEKYPREYIKENREALTDSLIAEVGSNTILKREHYTAALEQLSSPELLSIMQYDPTDDIAAITCPILAVGGAKDLQVPPSLSLDLLKSKAHSSRSVTVKKYDGLNHLFQHTKTGLPTEYALIEETFAPEVLSDITSWILSITK